MKYTNGINIVNVSKGAYNSIYKSMGYMPVESVIESTEGDNNVDADKEASDSDDFGNKMLLVDMSVPELKELAKTKGLKGYSNLNKDELIALIESSDTNETDENTAESHSGQA